MAEKCPTILLLFFNRNLILTIIYKENKLCKRYLFRICVVSN